jgi:hypothetical protein
LTKTIICLAASRKPGGRCIAGKEIDTYIWIRPVCDGEKDAVSNQVSCYSNGRSAEVLDIIEIPLIKSKPVQHQKENFLVDTHRKWKKKEIFPGDNLSILLDKPSNLWQDLDSSYNGLNDRIPEEKANNIINSLYFIQVKCKLLVKIEGKDFNNPQKKVRCSFKYKNEDYILPVTDPIVESEFMAKHVGEYDIGSKYICISLGLKYEGYVYLFVAVIL